MQHVDNLEEISKTSKNRLFMGFFKSTVLPTLIIIVFGLALFAVSARIWLPGDMMAPAPPS